MKEFKYVVQDELGLHARPAGLLVKEAAKYKSAITLDSGAKKADAKRIMAVMSMGVKQGVEVTVTVDGEDEDTLLRLSRNSSRRTCKDKISEEGFAASERALQSPFYICAFCLLNLSKRWYTT